MLRRATRDVLKMNFSKSREVERSDPVAHHGIQRSGTNFLLLSLKKLEIDVINEIGPARNKPSHKHFRWYADKTNIPAFISDQYGNNITADTIVQINEICGYPDETRHIVIAKKKNAAVLSLLNWGLRCGWFETKEIALSSINEVIKDYDHYYRFWHRLTKLEPNYAQLIYYEDLINDNKCLLYTLTDLSFCNIPPTIQLKFDNVPQSPKFRVNLISMSDIAESLIQK